MTYKPADKNPVDKRRTPKDSIITFALCCSVFVVVTSSWFIINCIYLRRLNVSHFEMQDKFLINITNFKNESIVTLPFVGQSIFSNIVPIILCALTGSIIFLLLLKSLNYLSTFWTGIGLTCIAVCLIFYTFFFFSIIYTTHNSRDGESKWIHLFTELIIIIVYFICPMIIFGPALSHAVCTRNLNHIIVAFKEISRIVSSCLSVFLLTQIVWILVCTIMAFLAVSYYSTDSIASRVIILLGGIYLLIVVLDFCGKILEYDEFTLDCSQNKEELHERITIRINTLKSFFILAREVLYNSTIIPPLRRFLSEENLQQDGFKENYVKNVLISNGLEYVLSHPAVVREVTKKIFNLNRMCPIIYGAVWMAVMSVFTFISIGIPLAIFRNSLLDFKVSHNTTVNTTYKVITSLDIGFVLFLGLVAVITRVAGMVGRCIRRKEMLESANQEMAYNEVVAYLNTTQFIHHNNPIV